MPGIPVGLGGWFGRWMAGPAVYRSTHLPVSPVGMPGAGYQKASEEGSTTERRFVYMLYWHVLPPSRRFGQRGRAPLDPATPEQVAISPLTQNDQSRPMLCIRRCCSCRCCCCGDAHHAWC